MLMQKIFFKKNNYKGLQEDNYKWEMLKLNEISTFFNY